METRYAIPSYPKQQGWYAPLFCLRILRPLSVGVVPASFFMSCLASVSSVFPFAFRVVPSRDLILAPVVQKRRYVHVELSHKTGKVVVLEMLGEHVSGELHDIADNERRPRVVPCDQVLILLVDNHAIRYSNIDVG